MNDNLHPDEIDLVDLATTGRARPDVARHVDGCEECQQDVAILTTGNAGPAWLPNDLHAHPTTPAAGQVWRVRWEDIAEVVILLRADPQGDEVDVAPVLDASVEVPGRRELSRLGSGVAAWAVRSTLPVRVLDRYADVVPDEELQALVAAELPSEVAISDVFAPGLLEAAGVLDRLQCLAEATWAPAATDTSVHEQLVERFGTPAALAEAIDVTPGRARRILRGTEPISAGELEMLRTIAPEVAGDVTIDPDLAWAMDQPDVRPLWEAAAEAAGTSDSGAFRWSVYASGEFALAARSTSARTGREHALLRVKAVLGGRT